MTDIRITSLTATPETLDNLSDILIDVVAGGGSVSFMYPLSRDDARAFWQGALAAAGRGERIVLGAWDGEVLAATVTLVFATEPNQPHRAELAKMMTRPDHRGRGMAFALAREAERLAADNGRTLLMLDTASEDGAAGLYEKLGFSLAGEVPDFALKPHGGLTGTLFYWKRLTPAGQPSTAPGTV